MHKADVLIGNAYYQPTHQIAKMKEEKLNYIGVELGSKATGHQYIATRRDAGTRGVDRASLAEYLKRQDGE